MTAFKTSTIITLLVWLLVFTMLTVVLLSQPFTGIAWQYLSAQDPQVAQELSLGTQHLHDNTGKIDWETLEALLLPQEPHSVTTFGEFEQIIAKNRELYTRLMQSPLYLRSDTAHAEIHITKRPLSDLPLGFWLSAATTLIAALVSVGIWSLQPGSWATRLLLTSGLCFSFGILLTIFFVHRHIVMAPIWFETSLCLQYLLMGWFPFSLVTLLLTYPRRVVPKPVLWITFFIPVPFFLNFAFRWSDLPLHTFFINSLLGLILGAIAVTLQWRAVRNDPLEVAGLRWFLISCYTAPLIVVVFYLLPSFFHSSPAMPIWVAHMLFLSLFLGFALGVARYRLFDVERWWLKAWIWFISGVLLLIIDFLLISLFNLESDKAMMLAIALLAWVYFPLRQFAWKRLSTSNESEPEDYLPLLVNAVLDEQPKKTVDQAWSHILATTFQTPNIELHTGNLVESRIIEQGLCLDIPAIDRNHFIRLQGRSNGTKLFSTADQMLASSLLDLLQNMLRTKAAQQHGAHRERLRIIRDLHDDIGANLLTLSYRAKSEQQAELARKTLAMLRETIYALNDNEQVYLNSALAEWYIEAQGRAQSANIELEWQQDKNLPNILIRPRQRINISRILREGISNAIKHGKQQQTLCIHIYSAGNDLITCIENESNTTDSAHWIKRNGMNNIRTRTAELDGEANWHTSEPENGIVNIQLAVKMPLFQ